MDPDDRVLIGGSWGSTHLLDRAAPALVGTGQPAEERGELVDLLWGEVLQEEPLDARDVGAAGISKLVVPEVRQAGVGNPRIAGTGHTLDKPRADLRQHWKDQADPLNAKPLNATPLAQQIAQDGLGLTWARTDFEADSPVKIEHPDKDYKSPPMQRLIELANQARSDFLIISPYFVPHDAGVKALGALTGRGVKVKVLTNSLAATDAVAVQAGYAPYRVPMLKAGVELYEFKPVQAEGDSRARTGLFGSQSRASLHAKAYVIDRSILVIGSMNLDPRSASLNTELALVIYSKQIANGAAQLFDNGVAPARAYRVELASPAVLAGLKNTGSPMSPLIWITEDDGVVHTYNFDPQAGLYRNVLTGLFMLLPVDSQL